ncbi:MAG TPA: MBL fold metallo-hydrolase [Candidatus Pullichristensenella excrementigallinarum]|uniref:MBL fold metallo-hydrolase n=1 Tax=Candidatus Pullichristensenella excrementigallinarum TaxID=2840907 RepID=A0A9D1IBR0_9FIRM|nr:MBL fold metallo-hydrolase [Candidatus Pullichristensenella excrementigallinarum]
MKLKWYGHSCFSLSYEGGPVLVTDPFDDSVGYPLCIATCDFVLTSHDHYDHNYVQSLSGNPERIADTRSREMKNGVRIYGIDCFHDDAGGSKRGKNRIFVLEGEGLRIAHLGDLGHLLSAEQLKALGKIDILLIPIGGTYTITTPEAAELIDAIRPHTAIAMHFRTDACHFPITDEKEFLRRTGGQALPTSEITVTAQSLEALPGAIVLQY